MKTHTALSASSFALGLLACNLGTIHGQNTQPNVILILADDMGIGDIRGLNPDSQIDTPNLDEMCAHGISFNDAHSSSALSTPSRYSILTGRYNWRTTKKGGVLGATSPAMITPGRKTIADMFKSKGYTTAAIGKWHLGQDWAYKSNKENVDNIDFTKPITNGPTDRGFDYFYGIVSPTGAPHLYIENNMVEKQPNTTFEDSGTGLYKIKGGIGHSDWSAESMQPHFADKMLNYLENGKNSEQPFFLYMALTAPHIPLLPSPEFKGKSSIGDYGDLVMMIDDIVGRLNQKLKDIGKYENTIVMFAADNGCAGYIHVDNMNKNGHYPSYIYRGYKSHAWEGGHRIPFILSWGDKYDHVKENSLVSLTDLYATFADMLGYKSGDAEAEDSYSFWPVLAGKGTTSRSDLIATSGGGYFTYRTPEYKLIFNAGNGSDQQYKMNGHPPLQLYDMSNDPEEKVNCINNPEYDGQVKEMVAQVKKYIEDGRSTPGPKSSNDGGNLWKQIKDIMDGTYAGKP
ncbi:arylsulfatase A-like enzyme [Dysgonomonas hofstadii]|uniref:Arylsulfatase A-like enzyme n=1 Tax=Dysgonomonas hofstadii TaxID=637886 RepID=A0A840CP32_9BACT|nr:sulfatase-like hydrolase/transferase [Dysgonomonas hofstadii]MBB4037857.1 arylsulfatase A-like enzyme [Dysgonomonas hofstadii]